MAKKNKQQELKHEEDYVAFLEKRLASKNFVANVTTDEYNKTKEKLKKARFKLRTLKESMK